LVPLEDGDRTEALKKIGKKVIAIDMNPMSRTARAADITIVDNIVRVLPHLVRAVEKFSRSGRARLHKIVSDFDNTKNLKAMVELVSKRLKNISR